MAIKPMRLDGFTAFEHRPASKPRPSTGHADPADLFLGTWSHDSVPSAVPFARFPFGDKVVRRLASALGHQVSADPIKLFLSEMVGTFASDLIGTHRPYIAVKVFADRMSVLGIPLIWGKNTDSSSYFNLYRTEEGQDVIVDLTFSKFFKPEFAAKAPSFFVGTREELISFFRNHWGQLNETHKEAFGTGEGGFAANDFVRFYFDAVWGTPDALVRGHWQDSYFSHPDVALEEADLLTWLSTFFEGGVKGFAWVAEDGFFQGIRSTLMRPEHHHVHWRTIAPEFLERYTAGKVTPDELARLFAGYGPVQIRSGKGFEGGETVLRGVWAPPFESQNGVNGLTLAMRISGETHYLIVLREDLKRGEAVAVFTHEATHVLKAMEDERVGVDPEDGNALQAQEQSAQLAERIALLKLGMLEGEPWKDLDSRNETHGMRTGNIQVWQSGMAIAGLATLAGVSLVDYWRQAGGLHYWDMDGDGKELDPLTYLAKLPARFLRWSPEMPNASEMKAANQQTVRLANLILRNMTSFSRYRQADIRTTYLERGEKGKESLFSEMNRLSERLDLLNRWVHAKARWDFSYVLISPLVGRYTKQAKARIVFWMQTISKLETDGKVFDGQDFFWLVMGFNLEMRNLTNQFVEDCHVQAGGGVMLTRADRPDLNFSIMEELSSLYFKKVGLLKDRSEFTHDEIDFLVHRKDDFSYPHFFQWAMHHRQSLYRFISQGNPRPLHMDHYAADFTEWAEAFGIHLDELPPLPDSPRPTPGPRVPPLPASSGRTAKGSNGTHSNGTVLPLPRRKPDGKGGPQGVLVYGDLALQAVLEDPITSGALTLSEPHKAPHRVRMFSPLARSAGRSLSARLMRFK